MKNLTSKQERILSELYGTLVKKEPKAELNRIVKYYNDVLRYEDGVVLNYFKKMVEAKLGLVLSSNFKFYQFEYFKEKYSEQLQDYIDDCPDSLEIDFINNCISEQNSILENKIDYFVELDNLNSLNVMEFVNEDFLDEYKNSSKRKNEFLLEKLYECNQEKNMELNPYPLLFVSKKVYDNFLIYTSRYIIDYYIDYSYLKKRLELEGLIYRTTDNCFMKLIFEEFNLISERRYQEYTEHNKLRSIKKSQSSQRENNYNLVFKNEA